MKIETINTPLEQIDCDIALLSLSRKASFSDRLPIEIEAQDWRLNGSISQWLERYHHFVDTRSCVVFPTATFGLCRMIAIVRMGQWSCVWKAISGIHWSKMAMSCRADFNLSLFLKSIPPIFENDPEKHLVISRKVEGS